MSPLSGNEKVLLGLCLAAAVAGWGAWYWSNAIPRRLAPAYGPRAVLLAAPLVCAGLMACLLRVLPPALARPGAEVVAFYTCMGMALVGLAANGLSFLGLSPRDDVTERGNLGAAVACASAVLAFSLCFVGASLADWTGPDRPYWWMALSSAVVAVAGFVLYWAVAEWLAGASDAITIGRDLGVGVRWSAFLAAAGMLAAYAASASGTASLRRALPLLALLAAEAALSRLVRPSRRRPHVPLVPAGLVPAAVYLLAAGGYLGYLRWRG